MSDILITGASGFLGGEILKDFSLKDKTQNFKLLVRPTDIESAESRLKKITSKRYGKDFWENNKDRFQIIEGDLENDYLGVGRETLKGLLLNVEKVIHSAASVSFNDPLEVARNKNVLTTSKLLDCLELVNYKPELHFISTAYVAGDSTNCLLYTSPSPRDKRQSRMPSSA